MSDFEQKYIVNYFVDGQDLLQDEYSEIVPAIGQGVHLEGVFYRVKDVWYNREKHAPVPWGIVAFLERVSTPDVFTEVDDAYYRP